MPDTSVAYLETTRTTHICIWVQGERGTKMASGRWSFNYSPATLCGWKKTNFTSRARVLYTLLDERPRYPLCQTCAQVVTVASALAKNFRAVVEVIDQKNPAEESNA